MCEQYNRYKLRISVSNRSRFHQLATQLRWRLAQGDGESFYCIGVEDNGHPRGLDTEELESSLNALKAIADEVGAVTEVMEILPGTEKRSCAVVRVHHQACATLSSSLTASREVRVVVGGGSGSGKSTLVSVLTHGVDGKPSLDDGRGAARMTVHKHKHEVSSGRTSSLSVQVAGYDSLGTPLNYSMIEGTVSPSPKELAGSAKTLVRLVDVSGHEKFTKTSLHGILATAPDFAVVCVCGLQGFTGITRDHLALVMALNIPPCVVITKNDLVEDSDVQNIMNSLHDILSTARSVSATVSSLQEDRQSVEDSTGDLSWNASIPPAQLVTSERIARDLADRLIKCREDRLPLHQMVVPVFTLSSVTGESIDLLHVFLGTLKADLSRSSTFESTREWYVRPPSPPKLRSSNPDAISSSSFSAPMRSDEGVSIPSLDSSRSTAPSMRFQVETAFIVANVGPVLSGVVMEGCLRRGTEVFHGTGDAGQFRRARVTGIHRFKVEVDEARAGQHATVAVEYLDIDTEEDKENECGGDIPFDANIEESINVSGIKAGSRASDLQSWSSMVRSSTDEDIALIALSSSENTIVSTIDSSKDLRSTSSLEDRRGGETEGEEEDSTEASYKILGRSWGESRSHHLLQYARRSTFHNANTTIQHVHKECTIDRVDAVASRHMATAAETTCSLPGELLPSETISFEAADSSRSLYRFPAKEDRPSRSLVRVPRGAVLLDRIQPEKVRWQFDAYVIAGDAQGWREWLSYAMYNESQNGKAGTASGAEVCSLHVEHEHRWHEGSMVPAFQDHVMRTPPFPSSTPCMTECGCEYYLKSSLTCLEGLLVARAPEALNREEGDRGSSESLFKADRPRYVPMVHCGGIRQLAEVTSFAVVEMDEFYKIVPSHAALYSGAMAALLRSTSEGVEDVLGGNRRPWCARISLRFFHRPEFLQSKLPLILRDVESGRVSAVGVIA